MSMAPPAELTSKRQHQQRIQQTSKELSLTGCVRLGPIIRTPNETARKPRQRQHQQHVLRLHPMNHTHPKMSSGMWPAHDRVKFMRNLLTSGRRTFYRGTFHKNKLSSSWASSDNLSDGHRSCWAWPVARKASTLSCIGCHDGHLSYPASQQSFG